MSNRYWILPAAVVMQMCLGATYSWSVFVQPTRAATGLLQGPVQLPFSIFYFVFPGTVIFSGSLLYRWGPRFCASTGGLLFGTGWMLAGLGSYHFVFTILGIGVLAGMGAGMAYIVPITVCIQWFPRYKGLVTGIAVAGFGGGAALVSQVAGRLMADIGMAPFGVFTVFGALFLLGIGLPGLMMRHPPLHKHQQQTRLPLRALFSAKAFWILYAAMFTGLAAGFAVNANLKELYALRSIEAGIMAVSVFALANATGRIVWGLMFDRIRSATAIQANLICQAIVLLSAPWVLRSDAGLLVFALATGFNYGGVLVLYASSAARQWGDERVGRTYAWLFSANIPAAVSPLLAGYGYDLTGGFNLSLALIAVMLIGAALWVGYSRRVIDGAAVAMAP